jgi:hypothetical protein
MRTRLLLNFLLLALAVGLALVLVLEPGKEEPAPPPTLSALSPAAITAVRIEARDQEALEVRREEGHWRLLTPLQLPANPFRMSALTDLAQIRSEGRFSVAGHDLQEFGLADPSAKLYLDGKEFAFGNTEPLHGRRYVLVDGMIHLISDRLYLLTEPAADFVHLALLGSDAEPVAFVLPEFKVTRQNGQWLVTPEGPTPQTVENLVRAWRDAQAITVKPYQEDLSSTHSISVYLQGSPEKPISFQVVREEYELIFQRPDLGIQYHLLKSLGERLLTLETPSPGEDEQEEEPPS